MNTTMRSRRRSDGACLLALAAATAVLPSAPAADLYYMGAQYTPGVGYPAPWPTEGSWFDKNLWQNNTLPTSTTNAIIGSTQSMPNTNTTHAPHILHFGNFGYFGTTVIPGGSASAGTITIRSDIWTFDFASSQNPDFTGSLTSSTGYLYMGGTLSLAPATGQFASLTVQSGTLTVGTLALASQSGGQAILNLTSGWLNTGGTIGVSGAGTVLQTGVSRFNGGDLFLGYNAGSTGSYSLSSGTLSSNGETLGYRGSGVFSQTGGTHTVSGLILGDSSSSTGTYTLSNGRLTCTTEYLGNSGTGLFTQTGGNYSLTTLFSAYNIGATGSYNLEAGQLTVGTVYLANSGTASLTQNGGTHTVSGTLLLGCNAGATGTYFLNDGQLTTPVEHVGSSGAGTFTQSGGMHIINGPDITGDGLCLGHGAGSTGSYVLSGGQLTSVTDFVGYFGAGVFTQTGGTHSITSGSLGLCLGFVAGVSGSYTLSGGQLSAQKDEYIGYSGPGTFSQSGGTHTVSGTLYLGYHGATGIYSLSDGVLNATAEIKGGKFTQSGGTHTVSSSFYLMGSYTLTSGGLLMAADETMNGAFMQSGGTHVISGALSLGMNTNGQAFYTLSNGLLNAATESIGNGTLGTFTQTGGTHTVSGYLAIAVFGDSSAYILSNAGVLSTAYLYLGGSNTKSGGTGTLTIAGGTATITNTLKFWSGFNSRLNSRLDLSGGTLTVGLLDIVSDPSRFVWTAGTLIITGPTAPALTIPTAGTFLGAPTIGGNLTNNGFFSPGQSPGLLTIQGDFTQSDTATLLLEIAGTALADFDRLTIPGTGTVPGNVSLAGTVALDFLPGYTPRLGDAFDFIDWTGSFTDSGYSFNFTHASLPDGLAWDTSKFSTTGQLTIIAVPEPASLSLLALSLPLLTMRRRKFVQ